MIYYKYIVELSIYNNILYVYENDSEIGQWKWNEIKIIKQYIMIWTSDKLSIFKPSKLEGRIA